MAEDKSDEVLEKKPSKDSQTDEAEKPQKGGLSTSLLIKVAIGLGIILIAMVVALFLLSSSPETDPAATDDTEISETESQEVKEATEDDSTIVTPESGPIELPSLAETPAPTKTTSAPTAQNDNTETAAVTPSAQAVPSAKAPSNNVLAEMVALQKQLDATQQENQKLIKRVEQLIKENQSLQRGTTSAAATTTANAVNDPSFVSNNDVPSYYRENRYSTTPQPELKPQWGEFQTLK